MVSKNILTSLPENPGVYQFLDKYKQVIYVGKAKNLKKRVSSYFQNKAIDLKTSSLVANVCDIKIIITSTENEAFLLEDTLIKRLKPRYNILFKDDKSYPYILITKHEFPRLMMYRGEIKKHGFFYGPYPSATIAHEVIAVLQQIFGLRSCGDMVFRNRVRPCIQYQIKRCSAPCVGCIEAMDYTFNVQLVTDFLQGKDDALVKNIRKEMLLAAEQLNYEKAALYRNQLQNLEKIQIQQYVVSNKLERDIDVIALAEKDAMFCVAVLFIRRGKVVDAKTYFSQKDFSIMAYVSDDVLEQFVSQYYLKHSKDKSFPKKILLTEKLTNKNWLSSVLTGHIGYKIPIITGRSEVYKQWQKMAINNAQEALNVKLKQLNSNLSGWQDLQKIFNISDYPNRIECFDVSHTSGAHTIASCVVFEPTGPRKNQYRYFNIANVSLADDYAALAQALHRCYIHRPLPDLLIIDGGKGQLAVAKRILATLVNATKTTLLAIAKGAERKPGKEVIYLSGCHDPIILPEHSSVLHLLQQIRDEAHRFAISSHRRKMTKKQTSSILENIPGIGAKRRKILLIHYKSIENIKSANIVDLMKLLKINEESAHRLLVELESF